MHWLQREAHTCCQMLSQTMSMGTSRYVALYTVYPACEVVQMRALCSMFGLHQSKPTTRTNHPTSELGEETVRCTLGGQRRSKMPQGQSRSRQSKQSTSMPFEWSCFAANRLCVAGTKGSAAEQCIQSTYTDSMVSLSDDLRFFLLCRQSQ